MYAKSELFPNPFVMYRRRHQCRRHVAVVNARQNPRIPQPLPLWHCQTVPLCWPPTEPGSIRASGCLSTVLSFLRCFARTRIASRYRNDDGDDAQARVETLNPPFYQRSEALPMFQSVEAITPTALLSLDIHTTVLAHESPIDGFVSRCNESHWPWVMSRFVVTLSMSIGCLT